MNKKLLAAAIAAAATLPMAAQASVQIYGVIHAAIDYYSPDAGDGYWDVTNHTSRIGFKGSEDLGNGLKAIWKVEQGVNIAEGGGSWATRNAYIGLAGDWGTFLYGRHDTPLKISTGSLDLFADTVADYNTTVGFTDIRATDAIAYISPNMNGLTLAGAIVPGADYPAANDGIADGYSIAAMYSNNGLFLAAAYEDIEDLVGSENDRWRVGAGYDMNAFHVGLVYESESLSGTDIDKWQVSGSYTFGNNVVKAMYGNYDPDGSDDADSWAIGLDHNFSKRTTAYVMYTDSELGVHDYGAGEADAFSLGMIHKF